MKPQRFSWLHKLRQPYVLHTSAARRWGICLLYSSFVFLFLFIFQPFGLGTLPTGTFAVSLGYGLTTFAVMALLNVALFALLPKWFTEEKWTVGREFLWVLVNILLIGFANLVYSGFLQQFSFSLRSLLLIEGYTLAVGIFPVGSFILLKEARLKKKYEQSSASINVSLKEQPAEKEVQEIAGTISQLLIPAENSKDDFNLALQQLLYIRSADNYVEVFYTGQKEVSRKLIRNSLKNVAEALAGYPRLFRCHKSYLVNLDRVSHVSGNAQGYKLHLPGLDNLVPVSRQFNDEIAGRLAPAP